MIRMRRWLWGMRRMLGVPRNIIPPVSDHQSYQGRTVNCEAVHLMHVAFDPAPNMRPQSPYMTWSAGVLEAE